jgi:hypothetical protein
LLSLQLHYLPEFGTDADTEKLLDDLVLAGADLLAVAHDGMPCLSTDCWAGSHLAQVAPCCTLWRAALGS